MNDSNGSKRGLWATVKPMVFTLLGCLIGYWVLPLLGFDRDQGDLRVGIGAKEQAGEVTLWPVTFTSEARAGKPRDFLVVCLIPGADEHGVRIDAQIFDERSDRTLSELTSSLLFPETPADAAKRPRPFVFFKTGELRSRESETIYLRVRGDRRPKCDEVDLEQWIGAIEKAKEEDGG